MWLFPLLSLRIQVTSDKFMICKLVFFQNHDYKTMQNRFLNLSFFPVDSLSLFALRSALESDI